MHCRRRGKLDPGAVIDTAHGWSIRVPSQWPFLLNRHLPPSAGLEDKLAGIMATGCGRCGFLDLLIGGVGVRRGRRDPENLHVGEPLDFWRVEIFEPPFRLRLKAEMKLPGRAWLEFEVTPCEQGSKIRQTAIFDPIGLAGLLYWYGIYPLHQFVFAGMLRNLARAAGCGDENTKARVDGLFSGNSRTESARNLS